MTALATSLGPTPRIEIRTDLIEHNTRVLVRRLAHRNITIAGITKATLGSVGVARAMLRGGVTSLGESRVENIETLRAAGITAPIMLIRSPMLSQTERVVASANVSCNTELDVVRALSHAAVLQQRNHGVLVMIELGDLREGVLANHLEEFVEAISQLANITLMGIGTNLACQHGVAPDETNMAELSTLAESIEPFASDPLTIVSGGNSANLNWITATDSVGRVNHLRLGEAILLGREPLDRTPIDGLNLDAFTLVGEVIESQCKPQHPWGHRHQSTFGSPMPSPSTPTATTSGTASDAAQGTTHAPDARPRTIVALGHQDIDPTGITSRNGHAIIGASSDHLMIDTGINGLAIGAELRFDLNYAALLRAMTSPFVAKVYDAHSH